MDSIQDALKQLDVPAEYHAYETTEDADVIVRLEEWKRKACAVLEDLRTRLAAIAIEDSTLEERADVVSMVGQFDGDGEWVLDASREAARGILAMFEKLDLSLVVERILSHKIKPIFQKNPHPRVNQSTGRHLAKPAGGLEGALDHYEGQEWKSLPGMPNMLSWCVRHIEGAAYERLWHLIIPPVMTLLDDFETRFKIAGVQAVSDLLGRVPPELLRRTGMDGLMFNSLNKCFGHLRDPRTPILLRATIPTCVKLIQLTAPPKSQKRFDQLCTVLGDGIIGSVWFYSTTEPDALQASVDVLPMVLNELDIGAARYLKAIIPQLIYPLLSAPDKTTSISLQLSSARALRTVISVCAPRMHRWKGDILNGVCRCWVNLVESDASDSRNAGETTTLQATLQDICQDLAHTCPSVVQDEFVRLVQTDPSVFPALVGPPGVQQ